MPTDSYEDQKMRRQFVLPKMEWPEENMQNAFKAKARLSQGHSSAKPVSRRLFFRVPVSRGLMGDLYRHVSETAMIKTNTQYSTVATVR